MNVDEYINTHMNEPPRVLFAHEWERCFYPLNSNKDQAQNDRAKNKYYCKSTLHSIIE